MICYSTTDVLLVVNAIANIPIAIILLLMAYRLYLLRKQGENGITEAMMVTQALLAAMFFWSAGIGIHNLSLFLGDLPTCNITRIAMLVLRLTLSSFLLGSLLWLNKNLEGD